MASRTEPGRSHVRRGVDLLRRRARPVAARDRSDASREAAELNHRVANSLQLVASFLLLQQRQLKDAAARDALATASARVAAVAKLHRHLAARGCEAVVELGSLLRELGPELAASTGLVCEVEAERIEVAGETALQLALAVNELVVNAGKHAYAGKGGGRVQIDCRREPDRSIRLCVSDDGPGLPSGFMLKAQQGLGFGILDAIVRQLGGELTTENDGGARFILRVPDTRSIEQA